jgi:hypothetical protein
VTHLTQSHRLWREGSRLAHLAKHAKKKPPVGTKFTFRLNEAARVTLAFTRKRHGSKKRVKATLTLTGHAGANKVSFQGRTSRSKRLPPGLYTLAITATAANQTSRPATVRFTIAQT